MKPRQDWPAPVWDLPTRIFHWSLLLLGGASWASAELGEMKVHAWCGYALLVLVAFRLVWGCIGSTHARFGDFLRGPATVRRHWRGRIPHGEGHNPAGGWSVIAMLVLILVQGVTGLFNDDEIAFAAPLAHLPDADTAGALAAWHEINFNLLLALVALHVGTVLLYLRRGRNLIGPMLHGGKASRAVYTAPAWLALLVAGIAALLLWGLLALVPPPPPVFL